MLIFSSIFNLETATQKFTNFDFFLILADVTAVLVQANTVVSNDVKDNYVPLQPSYKGNANQYFG